MPYQGSSRLPPEFASKTSHIDVIEDDLIRDLVNKLESTDKSEITDKTKWEKFTIGEPLTLVFSTDGSFQTVSSDQWPYRKATFVKISVVILDNNEIASLDKENPNPLAIRDILARSSDYHSTIIPLQHLKQKGMTTYDTIREIIFRSMKEPKFEGEILNTLKWIAYQKWDDSKKASLESFFCPHCYDLTSLPYDAETGNCEKCDGPLFLTDMLGFHQVMDDDFAPEQVANDYMTIYETLLLFFCIRYIWEHNKGVLSRSLFVKDGPLSIRAQYSKLVRPIRNFLEFAYKDGNPVHLMSQEKTGNFAEHLKTIERDVQDNSIFIPGDKYIKEEVQQRPLGGQDYGKDTNYGAKVFVKIDEHNSLMLNVPTGQLKQNPTYYDLIGIERILGTINVMLSSRFESALIPIEMAHNIASLSTYPSGKILKILAEEAGLI